MKRTQEQMCVVQQKKHKLDIKKSRKRVLFMLSIVIQCLRHKGWKQKARRGRFLKKLLRSFCC